MFAKAYSLVSYFTQPLIISTRLYDKEVKCAGGAFVVLNDEGWIITAAHLLESFLAYQQHTSELQAYEKQLKQIEHDQSLTVKQKNKKLRRLKANPLWITNHSFWWGWDGVSVKDVKPLPEGDLVIGRLEPFEKTKVKAYPIIKDPSKGLNPGTSLCKLGYPFHELKASFDETKNVFTLAPGVVPLPLFPIEGIYTRNAVAGRSKDGKYEIKFLETSSPGLRGQSGGPIFDVNGTVWAIQSRTTHFLLGFSPKVKKNGKEVEENQFLNVGLGVHPELIVAFLTDNRVSFQLSDY
ncbi:MAG: serine protease [Dehalococcoidia bacterium]|nr:serine protease [Dehalococcoidia bacterium]